MAYPAVYPHFSQCLSLAQKDSDSSNSDFSLEQLTTLGHPSSYCDHEKVIYNESPDQSSSAFTTDSEETRLDLTLWPITSYGEASHIDSTSKYLYNYLEIKQEERGAVIFTSPTTHMDEKSMVYYANSSLTTEEKGHQCDVEYQDNSHNIAQNIENHNAVDSLSSTRSSPEPYVYTQSSSTQYAHAISSQFSAQHCNANKSSVPSAGSENSRYVLPSVSFVEMAYPTESATLYEVTKLCSEKESLHSPFLTNISGISQLIEYPVNKLERNDCSDEYSRAVDERDYSPPFNLSNAEQIYAHFRTISSNIPCRVNISKLNRTYSRKKEANPPTSMMSTFNARTISPSARKYHCSICQKGFGRPSSLNTHMYSHTGEKPFKCPYEGCGRYFSVVSNLRRHTKIHSCKVD